MYLILNYLMDKNVNERKQINGTKSDSAVSSEALCNNRDRQVEKSLTTLTINEVQIGNNDILSNCDDVNESQKYSFHSFVKEFQKPGINRYAPWNKERERCVRESVNKKRIILKEINQFDLNVKIKLISFRILLRL